MLELLPNILMAAADAAHSADAGSAQPAQSMMHGPLIFLSRVGVGVLVLGILLCLWRMVRSPHLADKVLAGDTMAMMVAGLVIILIIKYDSALYYDAALVVAILGFASTVAFSQYIGAKKKFADDPGPADPDNEEGSA